MQTDLVLNAFGADVADMVAAARVADEGGFGNVWTFDHFSGVIVDAGWSRDPFVVLGAVAASTERVGLGVLVANVANRHPAQLASAVSSLQDLAPGRVLCGIGAGAGPGSRFAVEQDLIGRTLLPDAQRRELLVEAITSIRSYWSPTPEAPAIVDPSHPCPPIIVGASGAATIRMTAPISEGVNIRAGARLAEKVALAHELGGASGLEISVFDRADLNHPLGGDPEPLIALGVDRRTLMVDAPYDLDRLAVLSKALVKP